MDEQSGTGAPVPDFPRRAVTALAVGNVGKQDNAATGGHGGDGHGTGGTSQPAAPARTRLIERKTVAEVPLTGLSSLIPYRAELERLTGLPGEGRDGSPSASQEATRTAASAAGNQVNQVATVSRPPKTTTRVRRNASAYSRMSLAEQIATGIQQLRDHAAGKMKLKTTIVRVPAKTRRVTAKKVARPSRGRKPA